MMTEEKMKQVFEVYKDIHNTLVNWFNHYIKCNYTNITGFSIENFKDDKFIIKLKYAVDMDRNNYSYYSMVVSIDKNFKVEVIKE